MVSLIGRKEEKEVLLDALTTKESEMIAIVGRRRVGKTFLVRSIYGDQIDFELVGMQSAKTAEQLQNFSFKLLVSKRENEIPSVPGSWLEGFHMLIRYLKNKTVARKRIIFFDELPWLASHRSRFIEALGYFWNSWASTNNVVVVICGSAASWMIRKIIHNKGSLHNRVTKRINLQPFTLSETEKFFISRDVYLDRYQILQLYMCMGGIPHYLKEVKSGMSAMQNIMEICFSSQGLLHDEFENLYPALFEHAEHHIAIVNALAGKWKGLTQGEIIHQSGRPSGGSLSRILEELEQSGFISSYAPFDKKKKDTLYRLTDEYSLFYLRFIKGRKVGSIGKGSIIHQTAEWRSWTGFAYESVCLKHVDKIKDALSIGGMYSTSSSFIHKGSDQQPGTQIDLLIDRSDHTINLCEIKFYNAPIEISNKDAMVIREKVSVLTTITSTKKQIFVTLISTFGLKPNKHSIGLIDQSITMESLF